MPTLSSQFMLQFEQRAIYQTSLVPAGVLTVISESTVAFGTTLSTVDVWDWRAGRRLYTLGGFSGQVHATAQLADGRLLCAGQCGQIRIGYPDKWSAATVVSNGAGVLGVLVARDGSFVTADHRCQVKLWRNGTSQVLDMQCCGSYYGNPFAIVGQRLVLAGSNNIFVAE